MTRVTACGMNEHILVVEDDDSLRDWIEFELGFDGYRVSQASDGASAIAFVDSHPALDLILLDVQLPGMDGFQICDHIQQLPDMAAVPVIFLTARASLDDKLSGFAAGAVDYLTKPFKMAELKARIQALLRAKERQRSVGRQEEHAQRDKEMAEAAMIQQALMSCSLNGITGVEVFADCRPARTVGGDLYDIYVRPDGRLNVVEADVSGKGMAAAMVTSEVRTVLREVGRMLASPGAVMTLTNARLYDDLSNVSKLVTIFAGFYTPVTRTFVYTNAGHSVAIYRPAEGPARILEATGLPLGIFDVADFEELVVRLAGDDLLVICSDGFPEASNHAGDLYGYDRLLETIEAVHTSPVNEIAATLTREIAEFAAGCEQSDDQTIIVIKGKE
jgi:sigma-B regulation protein RsbU (phosphoserine phosphatase)